jgi:hypothetical protein
MRILFISLLFLSKVLLTNTVYAQNCIQEAQYKGGASELSSVIHQRFSEKFDKHQSELPGCTYSILLAKFTVDSSGNIKNVTFTKIADTIYDETLKTVYFPKYRDTIQELVGPMMESVIRSTSGSWIPRLINGKAVESQPFILPFLWSEGVGCGVFGADGKPVLNNNGTQKYKNPTSITNERMLSFFGDNFFGYGGKNYKPQLTCVILAPLWYGGME